MKIGIGNDHTALELKKTILEFLVGRGCEIVDFGTNSKESYDYPLAGQLVAKAIMANEVDAGILICGTGIGISLSANKIKGIRAAVVSDPYSSRMAREHNNCQIIALGSRVVGSAYANAIITAWLDAEFFGDRHQKRVDMIMSSEGET